MSDKIAVHRPFPIPCEAISVEIGQVEQEILRATSQSEKLQLEKILATLQTNYQKECGGRRPSRAERPALCANVIKSNVILNVIEEHANGVRVIFGGNDGILVTIDGRGHVTVRQPEGPGDPLVRQAILQIVQGIQVLAGQVAVGATP